MSTPFCLYCSRLLAGAHRFDEQAVRRSGHQVEVIAGDRLFPEWASRELAPWTAVGLVIDVADDCRDRAPQERLLAHHVRVEHPAVPDDVRQHQLLEERVV